MPLDEVAILQPQGNLCVGYLEPLLAEFKECCDRSAKIILVDLQEVHFIDSAGLGALVRMHTTLKSAGRRLYLCSPTQQVQLALEISNLDQIIPTLANREELLKL